MQSRRALRTENDDGEVCSSAEACALADVNRSTLTRWVESGAIEPLHKAPGRNGAYVFRRSDVIAVAAARKRQRSVKAAS
nr:helix-turn-helix domain-containing protein [Nocardia transvalensis]